MKMRKDVLLSLSCIERIKQLPLNYLQIIVSTIILRSSRMVRVSEIYTDSDLVIGLKCGPTEKISQFSRWTEDN